jgi:predicted phage baseplate assembly protein
MALPDTNLDDRKFQDLVDQAKRMIPQYTPEWTDHNVSDPGIALIELFAWMTDLLLYRTNQVPDKMHTKFLELMGVTLDPPRAAVAPVTFYLSGAQETPLEIPESTEVATVRTETSAAITFSTEKSLVIRPPKLLGAFTRGAAQSREAPWLRHDLKRLELPNQRLTLFTTPPQANDAFYLALEQDHSHHVLALLLDCEVAGGAGVDPTNPPLRWEVWQGASTQWVPCELEYDGTGGFNQSGEVILHLPQMQSRAFQNVEAYWLRVRLTDAQNTLGYRVSPELINLRMESRGGTVTARHAITISGEIVGTSDGTPGQSFKLLHAPLLSRDAARDHLTVEDSDGVSGWQEVADFALSGREDKHYTLDALDGTITLGPTLPQTDGSVYTFGRVPMKGALLRFTRYQYGGGVIGNVPKGALSVVKTSIPYVARTVNRAEAVGGRNAQSLEDAKLQAPQHLRTQTRAVSADDYETMAERVGGVARAYCIAPGNLAQPQPGAPKPGQVTLIVLPRTDNVKGRVPLEAMTLSAETRAEVFQQLKNRILVGTSLEVRQPQLIFVSVEAKLRAPQGTDPVVLAQIEENAVAALYKFLNPYTGGASGTGYPFGRDLHQPELIALLQRVPGVEYVEEVRVGVSDPGSNQPPRPVPAHLELMPGAVLASETHRVRAVARGDASPT